MGVYEFINELAAKEIIIWREKESIKYKAPKGVVTKEILGNIKKRKAEILEYFKKEGGLIFTKNTKDRYEKFPLTDIQNSYVVGRNDLYELGGIACHGYIEIIFDEIINPQKIEVAWNKVIQKHDMLRAIVSNANYQIVQEAVPYVQVPVIDLREDFEQRNEERKKLRLELSNKQYKLGEWPMCDIAVSIEKQKSIVHFSLDMLIADFVSMNIVLNDLEYFYKNSNAIIVPTTQYRDVVIYLDKQKTIHSVQRRESEEYWESKLPKMGDAPELPVLKSNLNSTNFFQKKFFLENDQWEYISKIAGKNSVTPSTLIMACLAEIVSLWSSNNKFCINATLLNRADISEDINKVVGDFTDVTVTSIDLDFTSSFLQRIQTLQKELWADLEHNSISGVEILRKLTKIRKKNVIIPVVFTSTLGVTSEDDMTMRKKIGLKLSQTPQVYIDCQVSGENKGATINWDIREGVFATEVIDSMFESFTNLLLSVSINAETTLSLKYPVELPKKMKSIRDKVNATEKFIKPVMMEAGFINSLETYPNKTALITSEGEYTYKTLSQYVLRIVKILKEYGVKEEEKVGIDIGKGVWQIASVLATLLVKAIYVPLDVSQPVARKKKIIHRAKIKLIFSESEELSIEGVCKSIDVKKLYPMDEKLSIEVEDKYDRPAYIIFTSGTTGEPKGVIISHRAAMNTISDVNERYNIDESHVFLGLANLSFDLSVYDIFGCFAVGGTLILPNSEEMKNPKYLHDLIIIHKITVWNSVPAQMQMLINYLESIKYNPETIFLKIIFLSGDWIPVTLPQRIYKITTNSKLVSMGGATEASIWSIFYDIKQNEKFGKSVPYGKPMANQRFYVLNKNMQECPDYVDGSLYIGGAGLSLGYLNDKEQNDEKYLSLSNSEKIIYKTGDKGCYRPDGFIIFKGRDEGDEQVKINGHRVELAEIRSILNEHPLVNSAVVLTTGNTQDGLHVNALVSPVRKNNSQKNLVFDKNEKLQLENTGNFYEENIDQTLFETWIRKSDEVVVADIFATFKKYKVFENSETIYSFDSIAISMEVPPKLYKLLKRWLQVLIKENIIHKLNDDNYQAVKETDKKLDAPRLWQEFYQIEEEFHYSKEFVDYLKQSSDLLPQLVQGKEDPLNILFPKGDVEPAMAAYHDNKINQMLNDITKKEILYLCQEKNLKAPSKKFRILEVGAGVGGTSIDVIPTLDGYNVEYYFTDLSTFFLNKAKENFNQYNWVKYGLFDINKEFALQGYEAFSFDLILCANVLHNSTDVHSVMENLKGLLKDKGSIIILEETRTSYMLLTSMEFKDGLTGFVDERKEQDQTFFTREQWEKIFALHNAKLVYEFPSKKSKLDLSGQTIYVSRFHNDYEEIDKQQIKGYLENMISPYMIPNNIIVLPTIPLTANKKVDAKKIKDFFTQIESKRDSKETIELPQTDLEKKIEKIWSKELNVKTVGLNDNFYQIGGDSLIIAQVVGKMMENIPETKDWQWSVLLTEMMQSPTIRQIAYKIEEFQKNKSVYVDPCLVEVKISKLPADKSVAKVVFHAGAGTLTPYNNLLSYMEKDSKENESILGFTFGDDAEYIAMETGKTFQLLGQKYGKILENLGYDSYILVGHCVGGLIALETAHYLSDNKISVSDVTLISSGIPRKKDKTILAETTDKIYQKTLQSSLDNELLLERIFAKLINADEYKAGYTVNEERLQKYIEYVSKKGTGDITVEALCKTYEEKDFEDVADEFRLQSSKSISERLNALYNTIERPNGELMEHQLKMLNILFRIFSQNFRCVASYEPRYYAGNMRIFACEIQGGHFYPGFFEEDYETWKPYAKGTLYYDTIAGQHFDCITEPNLGKNIKKLIDFKY